MERPTSLRSISLPQASNVVFSGLGRLQIANRHDANSTVSEIDENATQSRQRNEQSHASNLTVPFAGPDLAGRITEILSQHKVGLTAKDYMPNQFYNELFHPTSIRRALPGASERLIQFIHNHAKRTFAITLLVLDDSSSRLLAMKAFHQHNFTDSDCLPVGDLTNISCVGSQQAPCRPGCESLIAPGCSHNSCLACFHHVPWNPITARRFHQNQWAFRVQVFDPNTFLYRIDENVILPFTRKLRPMTGNSGAFSAVVQAFMLADHQDIIDPEGEDQIPVAIKTLKDVGDADYKIDTEWQKEAEAYRQLNIPGHDHIVRGIAAIHQHSDVHSDFHLLLEWANGGNLRTFWEAHPGPHLHCQNLERTKTWVHELLRQMRGLASALDYMHNTARARLLDSARSSSIDIPDKQNLHASTGLARVPEGPNIFLHPADTPGFSDDDDGDQSPKGTLFPGIEVTSAEPESNLATELQRKVSYHSGGPSEHWRHGDIKPDNILRTKAREGEHAIGTLKLADLGRAQRNDLATSQRVETERELWRTARYEPPDLYFKTRQISRLFDIWSLGCVFFEMIVWALYGLKAQDEFLDNTSMTKAHTFGTPYWRMAGRHATTAHLSGAVKKWLDHIISKDLEKNAALGDLARLIKEKLLVIPLPQNSDLVTLGKRTNAPDLVKELDIIIAKGTANSVYFFTGSDRSLIAKPSDDGSNFVRRTSLFPDDAMRRASTSLRGGHIYTTKPSDYTRGLSEEWQYFSDDKFAMKIVDSHDFNLRKVLGASETLDLCSVCRKIDHTTPQMMIDAAHAEDNSWDCGLCSLIHGAITGKIVVKLGTLKFSKASRGFVCTDDDEAVVLRMCRTGQSLDTSRHALFGIPVLPDLSSDQGQDTHFKIVRAWLRECDENHGDCVLQRRETILPKRLLDVSMKGRPRIVETDELDSDLSHQLKYTALSHVWGSDSILCSNANNIQSHKKGIHMTSLPASFRDAIEVTRQIDVRYLWIDCLCILQAVPGDSGDFDEEAEKMRTTYSQAYCVIAACSSEGATHEFLKREHAQGQVKISGEDDAVDFYVGPDLDNFERDVLHSKLNQRGWVLQERALARRTIFYTSKQSYFECGDGIRCETLTKLKNAEAAFVGDPNFPAYALRHDNGRANRIWLFTKLFEQYSTRAFSHPKDRPVAIDGLIQRMNEYFEESCVAGLFRGFWGRCLLWKRADITPAMRAIDFSLSESNTSGLEVPVPRRGHKAAPSWSWMAYEGGITFLPVPGGSLAWNTKIKLPFVHQGRTSWIATSRFNDSVALQCEAFDFDISSAYTETEAYFQCDGGDGLPPDTAKCVIVGSHKQFENSEGRQHYVLLVQRRPGSSSAKSYTRIGVGHMLGKFIRFEKPMVAVTID